MALNYMGDRYRIKRAEREAFQDFYVTPAPVTEALLKVEDFPGTVWECACGDGAMSKVLIDHGLKVYSSDLKNRGYGDTGVDFLTTWRKVDNVITNPPYVNNKHHAFAFHALQVAKKKVALLLPLHFIETPGRRRFMRTTPLRTVWIFEYRVFTLRQGFTGQPASRMIFSWFVWEKGYKGKPKIDWLTKDEDQAQRP
jgi:hypothetical protein